MVEQLDKQAATLKRDLFLALKHLPTLPLLFGTPGWWLHQRYDVLRPYSELNLALYPFEMIRIVVQLFLVLWPTVFVMSCLMCALALHSLSQILHISYLTQPLRFLVRFIPQILSSRLLTVTSPSDVCKTLGKHAIRDTRRLLYPGHTNVAVTAQDSEVWYFVNGVAEQGAMVRATCVLLHKLTGRMVNSFVNASYGIPLDLLECIVGRSMDVAALPALELIPRVLDQLSQGRRVVLIGHSQGGIILSNVVKRLVQLADVHGPDSTAQPALRRRLTSEALSCEDTGERKFISKSILHEAFANDGLNRLEVYTFAAACDEFARAKCGGPFVEHFATELDFVARFGALTFSGALNGESRKTWNGKMYMLPANKAGQGHLMKEMILPALISGQFGHDSQFWSKYCCTYKKNDVDHHRIEIDQEQ